MGSVRWGQKLDDNREAALDGNRCDADVTRTDYVRSAAPARPRGPPAAVPTPWPTACRVGPAAAVACHAGGPPALRTGRPPHYGRGARARQWHPAHPFAGTHRPERHLYPRLGQPDMADSPHLCGIERDIIDLEGRLQHYFPKIRAGCGSWPGHSEWTAVGIATDRAGRVGMDSRDVPHLTRESRGLRTGRSGGA
jgi:hypothetical protein